MPTVAPSLVILPPSRTCECRRAEWFPQPTELVADVRAVRVGVLEVRESKTPDAAPKVSRYLVAEAPPTADGRLFRLTKPGGSAFYWVELTRRVGYSSCDCTGFLQHARCKHTDGLLALQEAKII